MVGSRADGREDDRVIVGGRKQQAEMRVEGTYMLWVEG